MSEPRKRRICLVSGGHPSSNPRLVKEADALVASGYDVTVVHARTWRPGLAQDEALLARRAWRVQAGWDGPGTLSYRLRRLVQRVCFSVPRILHLRGLPWAVHPAWAPLRRRALAVEADLYLGHTLVALPVVAACAKAHGAAYAFDVEDFHPGEREGSRPGDADWVIAERLLAAHLPGAAFVTAASPLIAEEVSRRYGVNPTVILNAFDPVESTERMPARITPNFYWFSQTIGPKRGLEYMIDILGGLDRPVTLELRGEVSPVYRNSLEELASRVGSVTLAFHSTAAADDMVMLAQGYTAGISSEIATCLNKELCLGNKIFTYLAAGTPVVLTSTRAQVEISSLLGDMGVLIDVANRETAVAQLQGWLMCSWTGAKRLPSARQYTWSDEKKIWLPLIATAVELAELQSRR